MFRRQMMAMMVAMLTLFPLTAYADARVTAAGALVDTMISDLETFLATDTLSLIHLSAPTRQAANS